MCIELRDYGFTHEEFFAAENFLNQIKSDNENFIPGRVIEIRRNMYKVISRYGEVPAELGGGFYHSLRSGEEFPVTGDFVILKYNPDGSSLISGLLPRRSKFSRTDFGGHAEGYVKNIREQVTAANFDYVFILSSLNHDFNINRIARYLTASWQSGAFPVVVLSKRDLCDDPGSKEAETRKIAKNVPVISVSAKTGDGLDALAPFLEPGKTIVFLGSSGVGKSSLLNTLAGETVMDVKNIRGNDSKGRHTTTHRQLFRLPSGTLVIDTPGLRELGLWDSREGMSLAFAELEELFSRCRFSDCTHRSEPGCAVLAALADGSLSPEQWKNYQIQRKETAFVEQHSSYLKQKKEIQKTIARNVRQIMKKET
ncbi:ribosome small subunit-dependent GTPase A [Brucepastera parasyntrophica]|uniref:ribosome small subunit-dependent GTPase A n=1 Tax=Brucepastera parasyntrophica TaxID=2880008 RepID=UPI00210908E2|nr:ribosome small subunit-dependent GTPase A [Brucepastera parasyntrophica]ULQ58556.1 ribosome small subunit-dependent GTPase A [Brucepastera parasyntrophica]